MKIKKGDKVKVIAGDDKGVVAEVVAALPRSNRVIVEGVNIVKKHKKGNGQETGGILIAPRPGVIQDAVATSGGSGGEPFPFSCP